MWADATFDRMSSGAFAGYPNVPSVYPVHRLRTQPSRAARACRTRPFAVLAFWLVVALWPLPAQPASALINMGFLDTPGYAQGIEVVGGLAYVADGNPGQRVIDVSNPAAPVKLGALDTPGDARAVEVVAKCVVR